MSDNTPEPVDLLRYIHMLIGDGRISFVNVAMKTERLTSSVEFNQKHFMNLDVENSYAGVAEAILQVTRQHPTRNMISKPEYKVTFNPETHYAYIQGRLALNKYLTKTRIPWALAEALCKSPVFTKHEDFNADITTSYILELPDEEQ